MSGVWNPLLLDGVASPTEPVPAAQLRSESEHTVLVHDEFFDWLSDDTTEARRKRARYCLRELMVGGGCARRKNVQGAAKGWVRTQLGGTGGSHYYLWWAPHGYPAVDGSDLDAGEILVRCVRHHDDTDKPLDPGDRGSWHVLDPTFLQLDSDLTEEQEEVVAIVGAPIRLVHGHPGSGKTTALQQAASLSWGSKALHITFSHRLAKQNERYLRTFAPQDSAVDSLTFSELVGELAEAPALPPIHGTRLAGPRLLAENLRVVSGQLGPWSGRHHELFAELHAHAVGRALPIGFRGLPPAPGPIVPREALAADRADVIGDEAADRLGFVADNLADRSLLDDLFPEVRVARDLVDRSTDELPARFEGIAAVFVDEVQDLTFVEAMLVLTVVARIGVASGVMPQLFLAGDEAQTVRPTAFSWAALGDLLTSVLGAGTDDRHEISLTSNMRSPRSVIDLIEATRSHYAILEKGLRPGGLSYDVNEAETAGKVLYCHVATDSDWSDVEELFIEHVSAQLVYPGSDVPSRYDGSTVDIADAENVKGLDFDLVGVVDAGARQREIGALASKAADDPMSGTLGRTIADQFRVAVSRSRENLLLLDRGGSHIDDIRELMAAADDDPVQHVAVADLRAELADDANPIDRLDSRLQAIDEILETEPERALAKARLAAEYLSHIVAAEEVPAPLQRLTGRLLGLAAALVGDLRRSEGDEQGARDRDAEASEAFASVEMGAVFDTLRSFTDVYPGVDVTDLDPALVVGAVRIHPEVDEELEPLEPPLKYALSRWLEDAAIGGVARGDSLEDSLLALAGVVEVFPDRPDLEDRCTDALRRTAEIAEAEQDWEAAYRCHEEREEAATTEELGRCLEALGRWESAADLYESDGDGVAALRCVREIPDLDRAIRLAESVDPSVLGRLRWMKRLLDVTGAEYVDEGAPITEGERRHLVESMSEAMGRARDSTPTDDAAVDRPLQAAVPTNVTHEVAPEQVTSPDEIPPSRPLPRETATVPVDDELFALEVICAELGISIADGEAVAAKLGIRPVGPARTLGPTQAERLRKRVSAHGVG